MGATHLFVFGTLLDRDLLKLVCNQPVDSLPCVAACMPDFEPRYVQHNVFPVLVKAPRATTWGEVITFDDTLMERLIQYETADFALDTTSVKLANDDDFNCHYFANVGFTQITGRLWTLQEWQQLHKEKWMTMLRSL